jgi:ABC-type glutathione transport system ATPase component
VPGAVSSVNQPDRLRDLERQFEQILFNFALARLVPGDTLTASVHQPEARASVPTAEGDVVLAIKGLKKTYGDLVAVRDLSIDICRGEIFGLLGPNGAGKTTTVNLICGLLKSDAGES